MRDGWICRSRIPAHQLAAVVPHAGSNGPNGNGGNGGTLTFNSPKLAPGVSISVDARAGRGGHQTMQGTRGEANRPPTIRAVIAVADLISDDGGRKPTCFEHLSHDLTLAPAGLGGPGGQGGCPGMDHRTDQAADGCVRACYNCIRASEYDRATYGANGLTGPTGTVPALPPAGANGLSGTYTARESWHAVAAQPVSPKSYSGCLRPAYLRAGFHFPQHCIGTSISPRTRSGEITMWVLGLAAPLLDITSYLT